MKKAFLLFFVLFSLLFSFSTVSATTTSNFICTDFPYYVDGEAGEAYCDVIAPCSSGMGMIEVHYVWNLDPWDTCYIHVHNTTILMPPGSSGDSTAYIPVNMDYSIGEGGLMLYADLSIITSSGGPLPPGSYCGLAELPTITYESECTLNADCLGTRDTICINNDVYGTWTECENGCCVEHIADTDDCGENTVPIPSCECAGTVCKIVNHWRNRGCEVISGIGAVCYDRTASEIVQNCVEPFSTQECVGNSIYDFTVFGNCANTDPPSCYAAENSVKIQDCGACTTGPPDFCCGTSICRTKYCTVCQEVEGDPECVSVYSGTVPLMDCGPGATVVVDQGCFAGTHCFTTSIDPGQCIGETCNMVDVPCASLPNCAQPCEGICQTEVCQQLVSPVCAIPSISQVCYPCDALIPDDLIPDDVTPDDTVPDDLIPDDLMPDDLMPDDLFPDDDVPVPDDLMPDDLIADDLMPDDLFPDDDVPVPDDLMPDDLIADDLMPDDLFPDDDVPVPDDLMPDDLIADDLMPDDLLPPGNKPSIQLLPAEKIPCAGIQETGIAYFQWIYTDLDGDREKKFIFQVSTSPDFTLESIIVDRTWDDLYYDSPNTNSQTVFIRPSPLATTGSDFINYNTNYYWRVKVYDETGADSGWVIYDLNNNGIPNSFIATGHPDPYPEFLFSPAIPKPNESVHFIDASVCYSSTGAYACKSTNPITGGPNSYYWWFGDGGESDTVGDVYHTYAVEDVSYPVDLQVCDENICCSVEHLVPVKKRENSNLPDWKEISPF